MNIFIPMWLIHTLAATLIPVCAVVITLSAYFILTTVNAIRSNYRMYKQVTEQPDGRPCLRCKGTGVEL